jgi:D-alanyl-D-alanine carboxypeptidase
MDARIAQIDQLLTAQYPASLPGAVVIVSQDGKPLLKKTYGVADMEKKTPLAFTDAMRIASVTKTFTAAAIMLLEEDGKLSLQDEITRHLPDFPTHGHKITIAHLLSHISGIAVYTESPKFREIVREGMTNADVMNFIRSLPLSSAPGTVNDYNNSGYYVLGAVIEKVSGVPYAEFLDKRIFTPLKMTDTFVDGATSKQAIAGYRVQGERTAPAPKVNPAMSYSAGALVSTANDMARWVAAVERRELLKPATWTRMLTRTTMVDGSTADYAHGWRLRQLRGLNTIEQGGNISGFQSQLMMFPKEKLSFIFISNQQTRHNAARLVTEQIAAIAPSPH